MALAGVLLQLSVFTCMSGSFHHIISIVEIMRKISNCMLSVSRSIRYMEIDNDCAIAHCLKNNINVSKSRGKQAILVCANRD